MYNPDYMDVETQKKIQDALVGMKDSTEGTAILENILGTPGVTATIGYANEDEKVDSSAVNSNSGSAIYLGAKISF